ncbi:MAG: glycosyltransferase family 9 protein [Oligoflexia bacterium]|nr:glycosyltransferase family 9 protein [Oligoflexia bacterium]
MSTTTEKILIIRLSSIGDIIQCSAIPRHLRKKFPRAEIHWLVRSDNRELVAYNPYVSRVISFERALGFKGWLAQSKILADAGYTHVYDAHNNLRSHILSFYLRPKFFLRRSKSRIKRFLLFVFKINLFGKRYRAVDSYLSPLARWGIMIDDKGPELHLAPGILTKVKQQIAWEGKPWIAIAPATAWAKKTWPLDYWKVVVTKILKLTDYNVLILGGPKDGFCKDLIINQQRVLSLQGKLTLLESAAAVSLCHTLVAADTGILHMAECLQKNVVGILGPTPFGHPYRKTSKALQTQLWCQPCSKDGSGPCVNPTYQKCMKLITPEMVLEELKTILETS